MNFLVVGLGNPGQEYKHSRHNAGEDLIDLLAINLNTEFRLEKKFLGSYSCTSIDKNKIHLLKPNHYMNESVISVNKIKDYLDIRIEDILIMHDELDLPHGTLRFKESGGHGGHNGLRNIIDQLGTPDFKRLRIGIGRPGKESDVTNYVLNKQSNKEREILEDGMRNSMTSLKSVFEGNWQQALLKLHTKEE
jgi:PTH1 family peptidyl-tRNA hydrolase